MFPISRLGLTYSSYPGVYTTLGTFLSNGISAL
jgi:hypothetical protein